MTGADTTTTAVLVVGGGPIGLALACELGRRSIATTLIERGPDQRGSAKMIQVGVRTGEFCRQLGLADKLENWGFPLARPLDSVFVTDLHGHELARVATPSLADQPPNPHSPERDRPCPQTWFDPILQS